MAKIISSAVVGVEPRIMGIGPVEASNKALHKAGLSMEDIDMMIVAVDDLLELFPDKNKDSFQFWTNRDTLSGSDSIT